MDEHLNIIYEYDSCEKQSENLRATHDSKEEQQTKINQTSTKTHGFQMQAQGSNAKCDFKTTKVVVLTLVTFSAVIVLISLVTFVLSVLSYNASDYRPGLKTREQNLSEILFQFDMHEESMLKQFNVTLMQLNRVQNKTKLTLESEISQLTNNISNLVNQLDCIYNGNSLRAKVTDCGTKEWHRVAYLNMSDPSQLCPSAWRKYNIDQFRVCGRPVSSGASRPSQIYPVGRQYSKVCGRVIGIQVASPDAFYSGRGINEVYMDGVSITHGSSRKHIWSYVGSLSEIATGGNACPCDKSAARPPPSFVGTNYYCESGNPTANWQGRVFPNDKLWDGQQCSHEGTCCTGDNTPPWFSVNLRCPKVTSDDIEVRIMGTSSTSNEDTPIELLEIYVQ